MTSINDLASSVSFTEVNGGVLVVGAALLGVGVGIFGVKKIIGLFTR